MDLTKVLSGCGSGGGRDDDGGNGEVADGNNTADSHQHEYRDLFASDNEDYSKTLAKSSYPSPVEGVYVIKKDLEDTFKIDEEIEREIMAMVIDEIRKEILEQQRQSNDFFAREEERLVSKLSENDKQMKLLKAEMELISKNLELSKANIVSHALHLHSCKIKIHASEYRIAQLKANREKLIKELF